MTESILDFSKELNVNILDQVVKTFYTGSGTDQQMAQQLLTQFQDHDQAWTRVDNILQKSSSLQTKFIALQVLENFIQTRWNTLQADSRNAIRYFIVNLIVEISSDDNLLRKEHTYINKLNIVLVQILKQDWPHNWPSFIPEIVASSGTNLSLCENNMAILKLLSEEIFDYSAEQMTHLKTSSLRQSICNEFSAIFQLCKQVLENATKPSLVKSTLETMLRFLSWIPIGYVFETNLLDLLKKFFQTPNYRNVTLKCLTEIGSLSVDHHYHEHVITLFTSVMTTVYTTIPPSSDIASIYERSNDNDQEFIQNLALFLTSFLAIHNKLLESSAQRVGEALISAHYYLIKISRVDDREIFKICLEYWAKLARELFERKRSHRVKQRENVYTEVLSSLRVVMIEKMVKPEEVLIAENDEGEIVREFVKESDTIVLYKSMKEVLVYLTNLGVVNTKDIMLNKLKKQMDGSEWSWQNLNQLCWAIGSISGAMDEDTEKAFLVIVIKDLLILCEQKRGKDNKAVVASNIMYTVGQYPRFLKAYWKFLKTVVNKLFEFMHESHEGVQDMACDTFITISQECKRYFIVPNDETRPFVETIIIAIDAVTSDLSPQQIHTFYRAVGYMISAQEDKERQEGLIKKFMSSPNMAWNNVISNANQNSEVLNNPSQIKVLSNVLKTNISACSSIGQGFICQVNLIFTDLLTLYRTMGIFVTQSITEQGPIAIKTPKVRGFRSIKNDILKLIDTYIECTDDLTVIDQNMVNPLLEVILTDYNSTSTLARDAGVLDTIATITKKLGGLMTLRIPYMFDATFEPTLEMITKDFTEFPEHRSGFYQMLRAINAKCFPALLALAPPQFKLFIDSMIWGFKHTMRDIADVGLAICYELLVNISRTDSAIAGAFYQSYYTNILQDIFFVLTDRDHKSGFKGQTEVLALLFNLVKSDQIKVPLYDPVKANMTNVEYIKKYVSSLLQNAFPHLQSHQVQVFVMAMLEYNTDPPKFKLEVRDFLIQLKEFAGETAELFLEEKEAEMEQKRQQEREKALLVPGMIKPSELPTTMEEGH